MKTFLDDEFLLETDTAKILYHDYAKLMPIYDYHCHLSPQEIYEDKPYKNLTEVWLSGDHYKWRLMRSFGISETLITGDGDDFEKFMAFAAAVETAIGNPMYHWTHLELQRYFGVDDILTVKSAPLIWEQCNKRINSDDFTPRTLITESNVKALCTTDDPVDDLKYHKLLAHDFDVKVLPTFRPDKGIFVERDTFLPWLEALEKTMDSKCLTAKALMDALAERVAYFHSVGCRLADHGMDTVNYGCPFHKGTSIDIEAFDKIFQKRLGGEVLSDEEVNFFKGSLFVFLGRLYAELGWTLQIHIGALRNNNKRLFASKGADIGFDSVDDGLIAKALSNMLGDLDLTDELPKTILYVLNPRDNYVIGTMIGNFQGEGVKGKVQFGSGWWFNDQRDGMEAQLKALGNLGLLSSFVGMLTDSRSFLSYTRHEYFRRILCNLMGTWVENGEFPDDFDVLGKIVQDICYNNVNKYIC